MADEPVFNGIDLEDFLASAGRSFTDAQRSLLGGLNIPATMMLSNAELELKVAVGADTSGRMLVNPISSQDIARGGIDPGMLSTLRINLVSSAAETFDILPQSPEPAAPPASASLRPVPDLAGLTMDEAVARLKTGQWKYSMHAATPDEIKLAGSDSPGKVIRQQPDPTTAADRQATTVHIWTNLGSTPVQKIDGIGEKMMQNLDKAGIRSVGELSLADADELASAARLGKPRAEDFVNMAKLMARLTILGLRDEVVELLVKGAGIRSISQLAAADSAALYEQCKNALATAKIRSPKAFKITADMVADWVEAAAKSLKAS
ncbi:DUF4332 domain-containing protein [Pontiella sp.]|uniref:DUF4332 domain-containing protein n=1 Tax=Pontiella sp. TaxID=2837462 RepID=UPI0035625EFF